MRYDRCIKVPPDPEGTPAMTSTRTRTHRLITVTVDHGTYSFHVDEQGWPVEPCTRCQGTGHYSFNGYDSICYLCRSEEHTSELQSRRDLVCRLLLEKKKVLGLPDATVNSYTTCTRSIRP